MTIDIRNTVWGKRIDEAEKRGSFSDQESDDAGNWPTCACGKATADIPRHTESQWHYAGEPKDKRLFELGNEFSHRVSGDDFAGARETLLAIELRAREVAAENGK